MHRLTVESLNIIYGLYLIDINEQLNLAIINSYREIVRTSTFLIIFIVAKVIEDF